MLCVEGMPDLDAEEDRSYTRENKKEVLLITMRPTLLYWGQRPVDQARASCQAVDPN
jgi:hypothetical protein